MQGASGGHGGSAGGDGGSGGGSSESTLAGVTITTSSAFGAGSLTYTSNS